MTDRNVGPNLDLPVVDIQLRNPGKEIVFLTRAILNVRKVWHLAQMGEINDTEPPRKDYDLNIKLKVVPNVATRNISQSVKPNGVDRFLLTINSPDVRANHNFLVLADLTLQYNKTHKLQCGNLLFVMESPWNAPYEGNYRWG
jgi:hypothetical protein